MRLNFLLFLFCIAFIAKSQSVKDQEIFNFEIWKVVVVTNSEFSFFSNSNKYLGSKLVSSDKIIYRDKWKRVIKTIRLVNKPVLKSIKKNQKEEGKSLRTVISPVAKEIKIQRNLATYYSSDGTVIRTLKKRGRKIYYHNVKGKLQGYKVYQSNGGFIYKDARGRLTGNSFLNAEGVLIFRRHNRRKTPKFMLADPFYFKN
ncbi:MAG: hypothetical protein P8Q42_03715 [Flavobacteriales bacterium]|nr:hypothetical protein [Flavobacteriales bacterium]|tara:strand:- start:437 stop:1039 length:603 start_codon:yes stop_codon:yes gene_type:complete